MDELNMSQHCTPVAKQPIALQATLGVVSRVGEEIFSSAQHCVRHPRVLGLVLGSPAYPV